MNLGVLRRAALLLGTASALSLVLAQPAAAGKGVGLLPPGTYQSSFAGADYSGFANNVQVFFNVSAFTQSGRPTGAPQTTTSETDVWLNLYDYTSQTFTSACLVLPQPSDFSIDNRLQSAALTTVLTPSTPTCAFTSPLTTNVAISCTWTGVGPLANSTDVNSYSCAGYVAESSGQNLTNTAKANFSMTIGDSTTVVFPATQTALNSGSSRASAQGAIDPYCGPAGIGSGPSPAGHYRLFGLFANGFWMNDSFQFNQVSLSTGAGETDLDLGFSSDTISGFGCFAIPASDATLNGLDSASVQTSVSGTPICSNSYPGFGLSFPLTVNASWTGFGPVMKVHSQSNYQCLGYNESSSAFVQNRGATSSVTATMPDYFGNPITLTLNDGFGSLSQISQSIQAHGVLPQSCLIRF